jgi:hypothetical protein
MRGKEQSGFVVLEHKGDLWGSPEERKEVVPMRRISLVVLAVLMLSVVFAVPATADNHWRGDGNKWWNHHDNDDNHNKWWDHRDNDDNYNKWWDRGHDYYDYYKWLPQCDWYWSWKWGWLFWCWSPAWGWYVW